MASVLSFSEYLGGPDNIAIEQIFPSTQRTLQYNFALNIAGWNFHVDHQTLVVDTMTFDRSGEPNFATSSVIGYFAPGQVTTSSFVNVVSTASGLVNITIPTQLYNGPILADARKNVPITIVGVTWTDAGVPNKQINSHRWAFIQCYEPGVAPTDPTLNAGFTLIT